MHLYITQPVWQLSNPRPCSVHSPPPKEHPQDFLQFSLGAILNDCQYYVTFCILSMWLHHLDLFILTHTPHAQAITVKVILKYIATNSLMFYYREHNLQHYEIFILNAIITVRCSCVYIQPVCLLYTHSLLSQALCLSLSIHLSP